MNTIIIEVKLFGELGIGGREQPISLELEEGSTVADVVRQIHFRSGEVWLTKIGQDLVGRDRVLRNGETLVLFPPVGGG